MKTAMQELMNELDDIVTESTKKKWIEKEKEQIIDAYYGNIDGVYGYRKAGEEYYNQTYNQKQHIIDIMKADEDDGLYNQNK